MKDLLPLFKYAVEEASIGMLFFDKKTFKCTFANRLALEILETKDNQFTLDSLYDLASGNNNSFGAEHVENLGGFKDLLIRKLNGDLFMANIEIREIAKNILLLTILDLTVQRKLQREIETKQSELMFNSEELLRQNQQLKELDKAKDRFFAITSHEIRTPISSIVATAKYVEDGLCDSPEEMASHMSVILQEGRHLLEIVNDILDFTKIRAGKMEMYIEQLDAVELLNNRIEGIRKTAESKGIEIIKNLPPNQQSYFDLMRLTQVFDNVLSNAVKYNRPNGKVYVDLGFAHGADFIKISIRDTGFGIPKEKENAVFNEFETVENIRNHQKGTGLGMPISKNLIECMGGKIYFESQFQQGTSFHIEIPTRKILPDGVYRSRIDSGKMAS